MCSHGNQHICLHPTYHPREQWLEIKSVHNPRNLISHTQIFSPDKKVSMFFDACAAIDKGGCGGIGYGYGGLAWERAHTSNEKYMYRRDKSRPRDDVGSYYCPYWSCVSWATWQRAKHATLLHKGKAAPDCTHGACNPVNFTVLKASNWTWGHIIGIRISGKGLDPRTLIPMRVPPTKFFSPFMRK
jgi:hypothetical protein